RCGTAAGRSCLEICRVCEARVAHGLLKIADRRYGAAEAVSLLLVRSAHGKIRRRVAESRAGLAGGDTELVKRLHVFAVERTAGRMIEGGVHVCDAQRVS